uniref:Peptidase S1 domain-containing protein n=1 Tax=Pelusios castaneus TaxID=367368 RepID=A0A8C8RVY5_9SAUR
MEGPNPISPLRRTILELLYVVLLLLVSSGRTEQTDIRIVGGYACEKGQPWQAALFYDQLYCGGVLINKDWVLTAAHCKQPGIDTVTLGEYNLKQPDESEQRRTASKLIPHPNYNPNTKDNNIMLIKLTTPVQFSNKVYPIALARSTTAPGTTCVMSGWGTAKYPIRTLTYCTNLQIVSAAECQKAYPGSFTNNMLCAGVAERGTDPCQVDSGGPLVCGGALHGIVSWGFGECALPQKPAVYIKISKYINWIQATIRGG